MIVVAQNVVRGIDRGADGVRLRASFGTDATVLHRAQEPTLVDPRLIWIDQQQQAHQAGRERPDRKLAGDDGAARRSRIANRQAYRLTFGGLAQDDHLRSSLKSIPV